MVEMGLWGCVRVGLEACYQFCLVTGADVPCAYIRIQLCCEESAEQTCVISNRLFLSIWSVYKSETKGPEKGIKTCKMIKGTQETSLVLHNNRFE